MNSPADPWANVPRPPGSLEAATKVDRESLKRSPYLIARHPHAPADSNEVRSSAVTGVGVICHDGRKGRGDRNHGDSPAEDRRAVGFTRAVPRFPFFGGR